MPYKGSNVENDLNPLTLGEMPEEYIENDDGSVDVPSDLFLDSAAMPEFSANLAEVFSRSVLTRAATELVDLIEKDREARKKRDKQYEEGLQRTGLGDDAPGGAEFAGSSRVVHPVLAEGCVDFAARAIKELFPAAGPVKAFVAGEVTPQKLEKADRKRRFMNWQLTTQIPGYRDELEQLLTQLPMGGSQYQKFLQNPVTGKPETEFVPIDELFLPYSAANIYTAARVTHRQQITKYELERRVKRGLYVDVLGQPSGTLPEQSASAQANDKIEGREDSGFNEDGLRAVLEVHVWYSFDEDELTGGEQAPYILTIDEETEEVLGLYRNWLEEDPTFQKLDWFVEWKFIPWRGAYAIGLPHLIGGLSAALTGGLRALLDSAHINNAATMLKLKSGRIVGQNTQVNVTQVCDIEGPAGIDDIRKLAMPMPFNPPSPVLMELVNNIYGLAKGVIATAEESMNQVGNRTPVGTTQALLESGSAVYSAIHARLHESQKRALQILHRINARTLDNGVVLAEFGESLVTRKDFVGTPDVIPVSDPTVFSETQRFAQVQSLVQMSADPSVPWNKVNIYRRALKQMRLEAIDELLPAPPEPVTSSVLEENFKAAQGTPLKAASEQNHVAHIKSHLAFVASPLQIANPLIPPQVLMGLLSHIGEHVQMLQQQVVSQAAAQVAATNFGLDQDTVFMTAQEQAEEYLTNMLGPTIQQVQALQQQLQQKMPQQAPMPPEVQASIQIAQMDTERKKAYDQAQLQLEREALGAKLQSEQASAALEQTQAEASQRLAEQQAAFDANTTTQRLMFEREKEQLKAQIDLLTNKASNEQKHRTEVTKNHEDNFTKLVIEREKMENQTLSSLADSLFGSEGESQSPA